MSVVARLFTGCLVLVVLAVFAVGATGYGVYRFSDTKPVLGAWSQPLGAARALTAGIDVDNGDVTVANALPAAPVTAADTAIATEYVAGANTPLTLSWQSVDATGTASLGSAPADPPLAFLHWLQSPERATWDVGLNPTVPIDLTVDIALGSARLDLSGLTISRLGLNIAVGGAEVVLGPATSTDGSSRIRVGVGDVRLDVPDGVPVSIRVTAGAGGVQAGPGFSYDGMSYTNAAWSSNGDAGLELVVEAGTGNVILTALTGVTDPVPSDPGPTGTPVPSPAPASPAPAGSVPALPPVPAAREVGR